MRWTTCIPEGRRPRRPKARRALRTPNPNLAPVCVTARDGSCGARLTGTLTFQITSRYVATDEMDDMYSGRSTSPSTKSPQGFVLTSVSDSVFVMARDGSCGARLTGTLTFRVPSLSSASNLLASPPDDPRTKCGHWAGGASGGREPGLTARRPWLHLLSERQTSPSAKARRAFHLPPKQA